MASRQKRPINLPAPYLRRIWLEPSRIADRAAYPFCLPFLLDDFELSFDRSITIIVGENGTGKSTLLEGIAVLAGYDEAGGGKGYMPVDHSNAIEAMGGKLGRAAGELAAEGHQWLVLSGREFLFNRPISRRSGPRTVERTAPGFPLAFARRGLSALLRGALPAPGHLHLR